MEIIKHINLATTSLLPHHILGWREAEYIEDLFYNDIVYDKIKASIHTKDITLIIGNPLSGKTRIVYDSLKDNKSLNILIPKKNKQIEEYFLPPLLEQKLVLLDDIDDYCHENNPSLNKLLKYIISNRIKCVITCRKGPEFSRFKKYLHPSIYYRLSSNKFHIERFDKSNKSVQDFLLSNQSKFKSDIRNFDGNFGSIVLPLDAMRERFLKLRDDEKELPVSILLGLKLHYHLLNYEGAKNSFDDSKIKNFCTKYLNQEISPYEWDEAKNILESTETSLNFIKSESYIRIEEAYVDFLHDSNGNTVDVIHNDFSESRIFSLFNKLYKPEEKQTWGFPMTTRDFNLLIKKCQTYEEGKLIFDKILKTDRDSYSYTYLMELCDVKSELVKLYKELQSVGLKTIYVPNYTFIKKFDSFSDLFETIKELDPRLLEHRNGTTNRLLNLATLDPEETLRCLFIKESPLKIYSNPVFNQILQLCCSRIEHFEQYIQPAIPILDGLDYALRKNIIKTIIKLKLYAIAIPLIEKYLLNYDYYNELANCEREANPLKSLINYKKSFEHVEFISQEQKAYTNINKLILANSELVSKEYLTEILTRTHYFLKNKKEELLNVRNTEYLREALILNEIQMTDSADLYIRLEELRKLDYLPKKTFSPLIDKIVNEDKLKIFNDFLLKYYRKFSSNEMEEKKAG